MQDFEGHQAQRNETWGHEVRRQQDDARCTLLRQARCSRRIPGDLHVIDWSQASALLRCPPHKINMNGGILRNSHRWASRQSRSPRSVLTPAQSRPPAETRRSPLPQRLPLPHCELLRKVPGKHRQMIPEQLEGSASPVLPSVHPRLGPGQPYPHSLPLLIQEMPTMGQPKLVTSRDMDITNEVST